MADEEQFDGLDELPSSPSPDTIKGKCFYLHKSISLFLKKNKASLAAR